MAFVLLPFYAFSIPFSELNFDSVDIESGITVEYPDYSIEMSDIKESKGALTGETTFYCGTEEHKAKILFPKFTLYRDGSFKSGSSDKEESTYRMNENIELFLDKAYLEKTEDSCVVKCKNAFVQHIFFYGKPLLNAEISFDAKGNLLSILTVEQRVSDDGTLSKPLLWQVFEACRMQRHVLKSAELQRF